MFDLFNTFVFDRGYRTCLNSNQGLDAHSLKSLSEALQGLHRLEK